MSFIPRILFKTILKKYKYFSEGVGDREFIENFEKYFSIKENHHLDLSIKSGIQRLPSPAKDFLPEESKSFFIKTILPEKVDSNTKIWIHFAGTGDEGFRRRELLFSRKHLLKNEGTILLMNPYYGLRRPNGQFKSLIQNYSDLFKMFLGGVFEGIALAESLKSKGFNRIGLAGLSMGGSTALFVANKLNFSSEVVSIIAPDSPSHVYIEGLLNNMVDYQGLKEIGTRSDIDMFLEQTLSPFSTGTLNLESHKVTLIGAKCDYYIPKQSYENLFLSFPKAKKYWLDNGHILAAVSASMHFHKIFTSHDRQQ